MTTITPELLRDYLNDALPDAELAMVEKALRESADLRELFDTIRDAADRGEHSVGAIWRRDRLSCPSREQLGGYLLQALDPEHIEYIQFHLTTIGCPYCQANLDDLTRKHAEPSRTRRQRIVKSSAGLLSQVSGSPRK
jgi:hypothetical protein